MTDRAPRFEIDPRQRPARVAVQVALEQLDYALAGIQRGDAEAVHEARKVCKKLRALLRLIRPFLGRAWRAENACLRDGGRALAKGREALVRVETADRLFAADGDLEPLAERIRRLPHPETAVSFRRAEQLLRTQRRRVVEWPIRELSAGSLMVGLLAGYRRARRAYRQARTSPTPLALHEWRKQAKYHGYQSALVVPLWPEARTRINRIKKLSDLLGEHHDLHVLALLLRRRRAELGSGELLAKARRQIAVEQARCRDEALELGKRLFGERPMAWLEDAGRRIDAQPVTPMSVTTWYLEMRSPEQLKRAQAPEPAPAIVRAEIPSPALNRFLYTSIGGAWHWRDRLPWTQERWMQWLDRPELQTWILYVSGTPAGYVELEKQAGEDVEIAYFGVAPEFIGRRLGGHLLTVGIEQAWAMGAKRIWVHTCTLDHPAALANYKARGMAVYKEHTELKDVAAEPPESGPGAQDAAAK